jgi:Zn-dependent protease with chaperone function
VTARLRDARSEGTAAAGTHGARAAVRVGAAVALLASWYLLAAALIAVAVFAFILGLLEADSAGSFLSAAASAARGMVVAAWLAGTLIYGLAVTTWSPTPREQDAIEVSRDQAPELWRTVEALASRLGVRPPARIYLVPRVAASITEAVRVLGLAPGPRIMHLGVPLLLDLPADQLNAIICHELGHYAGGHTRFWAVAHRGLKALEGTRARLRRSSASGLVRLTCWEVRLLLGSYIRLYRKITHGTLRRGELAADAGAAQIAGTQATVSALRHYEALSAGWRDFETLVLQPSIAEGTVPDDPFSAYAAVLAGHAYHAELTADRIPLTAPASPGDWHPALPDRVAKLQHGPPYPGTPDPAPAAGLLDPVRPLLGELADQLYVSLGDDGSTRTLPWQQWLDVAARQLADARLAHLAPPGTRLAMLPPDPGAALAGALTLLHAGTHPAGKREAAQLADAVTVVAGRALVAAGQASWVIGWGGTVQLTPGKTRRELNTLAAAAVRNPDDVLRLRSRLTELGIDPDAPSTPAMTTPAEARPGTPAPLKIRPSSDKRARLGIQLAVLLVLLAVLALIVLVRATGP